MFRHFTFSAALAALLGTSVSWAADTAEQAAADFHASSGWDYRSADRRVDLIGNGSTARVEERLQHESLGEWRGSGVLVKGSDGWRMSQYMMMAVTVSSAPAAEAAIVEEAVPMLEDEAIDSETSKVEEVIEEEAPKERCMKKRHKTNNRADC